MTTATVPRDSGDAGAIGRVAGNAALLAASRIVSAGAIFGWQIALARVLGAHDYGLYGSIAALMGIGAALVDPGVQIILVRDVARRPALRGRYLTAAAATHVVLALAVYAALQIVARAGAYDARIATLLLLVGFNLAFDSLGTLAMNQFIAAERMRWPSVGSAVHALVLVGLGAGGVLLGGRLWWVYVAVAITSAGRMVGFFAAAARQGWRIERPLDRALARAILSAGLPLGAGAVASLAFAHADKLVVAAFLGSAPTGQLTAAYLLVFGAVDLLASSAQVAALPAMARVVGPAGRDRAEAVLHYVCLYVVAITLPAAAALSWYAEPIVSRVFGSEYGPAALVLSVTAWCVCTRTLEGFVAQVCTLLDRQWRATGARVAGLVVNLTLTLALLGRFGLTAPAIGTVIGESVVVLFGLGALTLPASWWVRTVTRLTRLLVPLAAMIAAFRWTGPWPVALVAGLAIYAAVGASLGCLSLKGDDTFAPDPRFGRGRD